MKMKLILACALVGSFALGFTFKSIVLKNSSGIVHKRVTGIGGVFFKSKDPKQLREWYKEHLGLNVNKYGTVFEWRQGGDTTKKGFTQWSPFSEKTTYFLPSVKEFMINYRVEDLDWLIGELKKEGVTINDSIQSYEYGKFLHISDPEGNKIELWEANDAEYEKLGNKLGLITTK